MHLLQFPILPAPVTKDGLTPLGLAVREGKLDVIKCLVKECHVEVNGEFLVLLYSINYAW